MSGAGLRAAAGAFFREPLVHLLAIGACIYLAYGLSDTRQPEPDAQKVVVSAGDIQGLRTQWEQRWKRPPTPREEAGLVREHVRETVLYREALAMGLEQDDPVIRRRLAQKLTFLTEDLLQPPEPDDATLRAFFEENVANYRPPDLFTFTQLYFDPDKRGARTLDDARARKTALSATEPSEATGAGDAFMLQAYYPERTEREIGKLFGQEFAEVVAGFEPGAWHGPLLSGYGVHLVYVHDRVTSPAPAFEAARDKVREDWMERERGALNEKFMEQLLERYEVVIEEAPAS